MRKISVLYWKERRPTGGSSNFALGEQNQSVVPICVPVFRVQYFKLSFICLPENSTNCKVNIKFYKGIRKWTPQMTSKERKEEENCSKMSKMRVQISAMRVQSKHADAEGI